MFPVIEHINKLHHYRKVTNV